MLRFLVVISLCVSTMILAGCGIASHPTDQMMEQRLRSDRTDFAKLVDMLDEDQDIIRLDQKYVFLSENSNRSIGGEKLVEYRRLFKKLELEGGMHRDKNGAVRLIASTTGVFITNSEKSYVHSRSNPFPLVESLDQVIRNDQGDQAPVYKGIVDDWYLYYESW